jgi:hypothetical protein
MGIIDQIKAQQIADPKSGALTSFSPAKTKINDAKADAIIEMAKRLHDWPLLESAVDQKLEEQGEFVVWWDRHVRGKGEKANVADRGHFVAEAEAQTGVTKQQVSKWRNRLKEPEKYRAMLFGSAYHKAMAEVSDTTATKWTGDPESYTPAKYIEAARRAMGGIDLDPASNALAQATVNASEWFDESENGLLQEWEGRVFLNPPYSHPAIAHFIDKLCRDYVDGSVTAAILLTNNNTDTKWWHQAAAIASAVCFTAGRINFYKADGSVTQPTNGQNFFYLGPDPDLFKSEFEEIGLVMGRLG